MSEQPPPPPPPAGPYGNVPPPQSVGQQRPAELLDRFLARLVDGVILGIVFGILSGIGNAIFLQGFRYSVGEYLLYWLFVSIVSVAVSIGYFAFMESSQGATLGKTLLKLRVVGPDGVSKPTMEQAVRRNAFYALQLTFIVPIVGPIFGGLAYIAALIFIAVSINNDSANRQGWHDHFAGGTRVLKIG